MRVQAAPPERYDWLCERAGYVPGPGFRAIEVVGLDGRARGMVGFDNWTPASAHMHVAVESPGACRGLLRAAFAYLFRETGRRVAIGLVRGDNLRSLALARALGFREAHRVRGGWDDGVDLVQFEMRREDCRWMEEPHG